MLRASRTTGLGTNYHIGFKAGTILVKTLIHVCEFATAEKAQKCQGESGPHNGEVRAPQPETEKRTYSKENPGSNWLTQNPVLPFRSSLPAKGLLCLHDMWRLRTAAR